MQRTSPLHILYTILYFSNSKNYFKFNRIKNYTAVRILTQSDTLNYLADCVQQYIDLTYKVFPHLKMENQTIIKIN